MKFDFDFLKTCLSSASRQQLTNITRAVQSESRAAESRSALLHLIEAHAFNPASGCYIPLSDYVRLTGKLPTYSEKLRRTDFPNIAFPFCFFANPLLIPIGYGTDSFDANAALEPKYRATNAGFLVITIEYDCTTTEQLEQCLSWTRGSDGDFSKSAFALVDRELTRFKDYRGYTLVFTGNKSIHSHLIFVTKHLENAPWELKANERLAQSHSGLMYEAHQIYWDTAAEIFQRILQPSLKPDDKLRQLTQWKRSPWAWRLLNKASEVLGLAKGLVIPQLVIRENIRTRASRHAQRFLVQPDFKEKQSRPVKSRARGSRKVSIGDAELHELISEHCRCEWGEYPKLASVKHDGSDWILNFWNHPHDQKPSTFVKGPYRRIVLCGENSFKQQFYLPDHMSADELCDRLTEETLRQMEEVSGQTQCFPFSCSSRLHNCAKRNSFEKVIDKIHRDFAKPIAETDRRASSRFKERG